MKNINATSSPLYYTVFINSTIWPSEKYVNMSQNTGITSEFKHCWMFTFLPPPHFKIHGYWQSLIITGCILWHMQQGSNGLPHILSPTSLVPPQNHPFRRHSVWKFPVCFLLGNIFNFAFFSVLDMFFPRKFTFWVVWQQSLRPFFQRFVTI